MKQANPYKGHLPPQSEFSHQFSCWARNHNGWAKMKKANKKLAKKRLKRWQQKEVSHEVPEP